MKTGDSSWFRNVQARYFSEADGQRFYWQTADPYLSRSERALIDHLPLTGGESLLEVGCGEGGNLALLGPKPRRAVGVDYSIGKIRWASRHVPQARFAHANATVLPFRSDAFDVVFCRDVLHHLTGPDKELVMRELVRVCREGGRIIVMEPNGCNPIIRLQGLMVEAERDLLRSSSERLLGLCKAAGLPEANVRWAQPFPLGRLVFHYRWGVPRLSRICSGLMRSIESIIGTVIPSQCSAYIIVMIDKGHGAEAGALS